MNDCFESPLLAALIDRQICDASSIAHALPGQVDTSVDALAELSKRLPTGLVHAEDIYILPEPPADLEPLAPESAWYATERSLVVALPTGEGLERLLVDIGRYYRAAYRVHEKLVLREDLQAFLDDRTPDPLAATELAVLLDTSTRRIASLDANLAHDIAWMGRRAFDPRVHVHIDLCPLEQEARGHAIADALLARVPQGTFLLAVADSATSVELLSPYTRDLGHALYAWTLENPDAIRTRGLVDKIREAPDTPEEDLASLVVVDLFRREPDLLDERRTEEATQGLWLEDVRGTTYGVADLAQLAAPDPRVFQEPRTGTLVILAGGASGVLLAAARRLLDSARVSGLTSILGADLEADRPILAEAIVSERDGIRFKSTRALAELAEANSVPVTMSGPIPAGRDGGAPLLAMSLFESVRRLRVLGSIEPDTPVYLVLYSKRSTGLTRAKSAFAAARLGFFALLTPPPQKVTPKDKGPKSEGNPRLARRFRA